MIAARKLPNNVHPMPKRPETFIPAALDEAGLDPYAFRLFCRIARRWSVEHGCYESIPTMAEGCQMNVKTARKALNALVERGAVVRTPRAGLTDRLDPMPVERWNPAEKDKAPYPAPHQRARNQFENKKARLTAQVFERDGKVCAACGATENLTLDHIEPLAAGGTNDLENLQVLCQPCNSRKGTTKSGSTSKGTTASGGTTSGLGVLPNQGGKGYPEKVPQKGLFSADAREADGAGEGRAPVKRTQLAKAPPRRKPGKPKPVDLFPDFYAAYPRKKAREDAEKAWKQMGLDKDPELARAVIADVQQRAAHDAQWLRDRKAICYPATYLRGKRWNDELEYQTPADRQRGPHARPRRNHEIDPAEAFVGISAAVDAAFDQGQ